MITQRLGLTEIYGTSEFSFSLGERLRVRQPNGTHMVYTVQSAREIPDGRKVAQTAMELHTPTTNKLQLTGLGWFLRGNRKAI